MRRVVTVGLLGASLAGCASLGGISPSVRVVPVCGHIRAVSRADQRRAAAELRRLPANSVLARLIVPDWIRQRDEARACASSRR